MEAEQKVLVAIMAAVIYSAEGVRTTEEAVDHALDILKKVDKIKDKDLPDLFNE